MPPKKEEPRDDPIPVPGKGYDLSKAMMEDSGTAARLVPCHSCGRNFAEDRIGKHQKACKGTTIKAPEPKKAPEPPKKKPAKEKPLWKAQHEELV